MDKISPGAGGGSPPIRPDASSSSRSGIQKTKAVSGAVLQSKPKDITISKVQLAGMRPIDQSISNFINGLPQHADGIERAIDQWIGDKNNVEELYKANYRIVAQGELPLSREQQIKHNRITAAIITCAEKIGIELNPEHLNRTERIAYLVKHFSMGGTKYNAATGKYQVSNFAFIREALKNRKIPYFCPGNTETSASHLFLEAKDFDRLIDGLYASAKSQKKLNQEFANHFKDTAGSWGVELHPEEEFDFYTIKIPEGSLRKKYSVFSYLKEMGLIPENQVFGKGIELPRIGGSELPRLVDAFKVQNDLKEVLTGLMGEIDPNIKIQSGGASAANFYSEALAESPAYFENELKITKECVLELRNEVGSLVYPAAVQIQTTNDEVMKLFESYYKEFNFIAKDKKSKTFISQTRNPGQLHITNLNQTQFYRIKQRCNRLLFIHQELENTPHKIATQQLMRQEIDGTMLQTYTRMRKDKIRAFIEQTAINNKPKALAELEKLNSAVSYSDLLEKEKAFWKGCLNSHSEVGVKGLAPLTSELISPASITEKLYDNRQDLTGLQKVEKLCQKLRSNRHLAAHSSSALINGNIDAFLTVARDKSQTQSDLVKTGIQLFEQIVYRLEYTDLPTQRINQFFNTMMGIDWRGCSEGFAEKIQELLIQLGAEESSDQVLSDMRNGYVSEFVNIHYGADHEIAMYLGGIQAALNNRLGLGRAFHAPSGWGASHVEDGYKYVMSNYTPDEIYKAIYHEKNEKIGAAIAQGTSAAIDSVLRELGVEEADMARYYDPISNEYNVPAMQFDMPFLVLNYCARNNYLKWGANRSISPNFERTAYNQRFRSERMEAAPVQASSSGGGCGGGMR